MKKDHFYHGLRPYLHDALSFAMAELPQREQTCPMFEGASGGPQVDVDELVMVRERECLFRTIPDQDHRGMGQAPPWRHGPHYDHTAEGGRRSTEGLQTTSSGTPCSTCVYVPLKWQRQGFPRGQEHIR